LFWKHDPQKYSCVLSCNIQLRAKNYMQYCVLTLSIALRISKLTTRQSVFPPETINTQLDNTRTAYCTKPTKSLPLSQRKANLSHSEPVLQSHCPRVTHTILLIPFNIISHIRLDPSKLIYRKIVPPQHNFRERHHITFC
jgi:hypothetical protein